jgi:hypothetical protein
MFFPSCLIGWNKTMTPDIKAIIKVMHQRQRKRREEKETDCARLQTFLRRLSEEKAPADAEKAFRKVGVPVAVLLQAIAAQRKSEAWLKDEGRYIPYPASWLNSREWENVEAIDTSSGEWHETKSGVEKRAAELGMAPWDGGIKEHWPVYRARVMEAHQGRAH